MSEASDTIIERIRRLLRLAQSDNPHEAGLALERALQFAAKHKIDIAGLDLDPEVEKIVHRKFHVGQRLTYITKLVLPIVQEFFHVELVVSRPDVIFAGTAADVAIAHYVLGFLSCTCLHALKEFESVKKRRPSFARRQNFIAGFIYGIRSQLARAQQTCGLEDSKTALALADQRQKRREYMAELVPNTSLIPLDKPRRNMTAAAAGYQRGRETSIRSPLQSSAPTFLLR